MIAKIAGIAKIEKPRALPQKDTKENEVVDHRQECLCHRSCRSEGTYGPWNHDLGIDVLMEIDAPPALYSEVGVNRFEGHGAQRAFRPKVNGWTQGNGMGA